MCLCAYNVYARLVHDAALERLLVLHLLSPGRCGSVYIYIYTHTRNIHKHVTYIYTYIHVSHESTI